VEGQFIAHEPTLLAMSSQDVASYSRQTPTLPRRVETNHEVVVALPSSPLRRKVVSALKNAGYRVLEAVDACDAAALLGGTQHRGLILSNALGPSTAGQDLARCTALHAEFRGLPLLILEQENESEMAMDLPRNAFVQRLSTARFRSEAVLVRAIVNHQNSAWAIRQEQGHAPQLTNPFSSRVSESPAPAHVAPSRTHFELDRQQIAARGGWIAQFRGLLELIKNRKIAGPMVPELLRQVNRLFASPSTTLLQVARFAGQHQLLAARVIAVANSGFFGGKNPVRDLRQAVLRLGLEQCATVMQGFALRDLVFERHPALKEAMLAQLRQAHVVALVAEVLARRQGHPQPARAQMAGLFHNVGVTFFMHFAAQSASPDESIQRAGRQELAPAMSAQACEALLLLASREEETLNHLVARCIELPAGICRSDREPDSGDAHVDEANDAIERIVTQARWVAAQLLDLGVTSLVLTPAAMDAGIDVATIAHLNQKLGKVREAVQTFASDLGWETE
jgi:hypothetical protein